MLYYNGFRILLFCGVYAIFGVVAELPSRVAPREIGIELYGPQ